MKKELIAFIILILSMITSVYAGEDIFDRKIIDIGCHRDNGICYVIVDGQSFGSSLGCPYGLTNQFRFDDADSINGRRAYASLYAAFLLGKSISVYLSGCTQQGAPLLQYFHVK